MNAKAVLLIDNRQPQALEVHITLKQRVGAHHHTRSAIGNGGFGIQPSLAL